MTGAGSTYPGEDGTISFLKELPTIVDPDNGADTDYTLLTTWENALQSDIASTSVLLFDFSTASGTISDGVNVVGETSGATATSVHMVDTASVSRILLKNITSR